MNRYVCIHGHFYQPPRENPWLEEVEFQDGVSPYHDWNERVSAECYSQNAASRVLDDQGRIEAIINNYSRISFNFGPTLLSWLERKDPDTYQSILDADRDSRKRFSGHGSAIAQAFSHMILPLANPRDKQTQAIWGIRDFEKRFGRLPEGMWLPETAVDLVSLETLALNDIKFTILAPHQAKRVCKIGTDRWRNVADGSIDTSMPYRCNLPSGKSIDIFFYNGPAARTVAFEGILRSGADFAERLVYVFTDDKDKVQLSHIATDGESYGHHHRFGDMALAYALTYIERRGLASLTNYAEFLDHYPPTYEVEILENTSWSCTHGIERWRSNCGCNSGKSPGWTQAWRKPLREAFDWLRDKLDKLYEEKGSELFHDPWQARDRYIDVLLDRSPNNVLDFLQKHARGELTEADNILRLKMLGMQQHAMLMYTSCGWFFDELSEVQTVQVIQYAGRAVQLANEAFNVDLEPQFLENLQAAASNKPEQGAARNIYEKRVKPFTVGLLKVSAHYAVASLFEDYADETTVYCYDITREAHTSLRSGRTSLDIGRIKIRSNITLEAEKFAYAALHLGDHNVAGGVRQYLGQQAFEKVRDDITVAYLKGETTEVIRLLDRHFGENTFTLRSLFRDEQRKYLNIILRETIEDADERYQQVYELNAPVMRFLADLEMPVPEALQIAAVRSLKRDLQNCFETDEMDPEEIERIIQEAGDFKVHLDGDNLRNALKTGVNLLAHKLHSEPLNAAQLSELAQIINLTRKLPFEVGFRKIQNVYYRKMQTKLPSFKDRAKKNDKIAKAWIEAFLELGKSLQVKTEEKQ